VSAAPKRGTLYSHGVLSQSDENGRYTCILASQLRIRFEGCTTYYGRTDREAALHADEEGEEDEGSGREKRAVRLVGNMDIRGVLSVRVVGRVRDYPSALSESSMRSTYTSGTGTRTAHIGIHSDKNPRE